MRPANVTQALLAFTALTAVGFTTPYCPGATSAESATQSSDTYVAQHTPPHRALYAIPTHQRQHKTAHRSSAVVAEEQTLFEGIRIFLSKINPITSSAFIVVVPVVIYGLFQFYRLDVLPFLEAQKARRTSTQAHKKAPKGFDKNPDPELSRLIYRSPQALTLAGQRRPHTVEPSSRLN